jgi:MFS family permease
VAQDLKKRLRLLYQSALVYAFGENFAGGQTVGASFVNMYTVELGASPTEIGMFHSITTSIQSILQLLWGRLSDKASRRIPFIVLGGIGYSLLWIPILYAPSPMVLLGFLALQAFFASIRLPTWTSLVGDLAPKTSRGTITANVSFFTTLAGLFAILLSGFIMFYSSGSLTDIYFIPFMAAAVFGVLGTLSVLFMKEDKKEATRSMGVMQLVRSIGVNREFQKYTVISLMSNTALVLLLPIISLMTVSVLKVDKLTFALYGVVRCVSLLVSQRWIGRITDLTGRRQLMFIQRLLYILVPGLVVLAPDKYFVFVAYVLLGVLHAIEATANQAYLLDVSPAEERGSFISVFNAIQGVGMFASTLLSGYLIESFSRTMSLIDALKAVALITTVLRVPTAIAYLALKEPRSYPTTIGAEIRKLLKR